jgi:single-strand DNA-binding protein
MSAPITIKGRVGKDLDIKFTKTGTAFVSMSVVTNTRKKVNEEWQDADTSWWECKAFSGLAEAIVDQVHRGDLVTITGMIKQTNWVDQHGNKRSSYEILIDSIGKQVTPEKYHGVKRTKDEPKKLDPAETWF